MLIPGFYIQLRHAMGVMCIYTKSDTIPMYIFFMEF